MTNTHALACSGRTFGCTPSLDLYRPCRGGYRPLGVEPIADGQPPTGLVPLNLDAPMNVV